MITRLTGILEELEPNRAVVAPADAEGQPGAVAYEVLIPTYLADRLAGRSGWAPAPEPMLGRAVTLWTLLHLDSQNQGTTFTPRLVGFGSAAERDFFELLTSVKGLGNRRGLRAMAVEPGSIARAISDRDARFLMSLPEIGPKLAELIVHELRNKVDQYALLPAPGGAPASAVAAVEPKANGTRKRAKAEGAPSRAAPAQAAPAPPPIRQAVTTLVALGENPAEAERMVMRAVEKARAAGGQPPTTTEDLLAAAYAAR